MINPRMFVVFLDMEIMVRCIFLQYIKNSDNNYREVLNLSITIICFKDTQKRTL